MRLWEALCAKVVRRRRVALLVAGAATIASAVLLRSFSLSLDPAEVFPRSSSGTSFWLDLSRRFGALDTLLVGLEEPQEPLTIDGLKRLARITNRLGELKAKGVLEVRSLTNVASMRAGAEGSIEADLLIPAIPEDSAALAALSTRIAADPQISGALISRDQFGYLVLLRADPRRNSTEIARLVRDVVDAERGRLKAHYFGAAFFASGVRGDVIRSLSRLGWAIPAFFAVVLLTFLFSVRRSSVMAVVLVSGGLSVVWTLGMVVGFGVRLGQISVAAVAAAGALAVASFARGLERRRPGALADALPWSVLAGVLAVGLSGVALSWTRSTFLAPLGTVIALSAIAITLAGILCFVPVATALPSSAQAQRPVSNRGRLHRGVSRAAALLVLASGGWAATHVEVAATPRALFGEYGSAARTLTFFDRRFGGADVVQVSFRGDLRDPGIAARLMRLTDLLEGDGAFSDVRSGSQVLGFLSQEFGGVYRIPTGREALGALWFFLEGNPDLRSLVTDARDEAMIALRVSSIQVEGSRDRETVERAVGESLGLGAAGARLRLLALSRSFHLALPDGRIDEVLKGAVAPPTVEERRAFDDDVQGELRRYLASPESPYQPSESEWRRIWHAVSEGDGSDHEQVDDVARSIGGLTEHDGVTRFVDYLSAGLKDIRLRIRSRALAKEIIDKAQVPESAEQRLQGVFVDFLDPHTSAGEGAQVVVSGLPVISAEVSRDMLRNWWRALGVVGATAFLALLALRRSPWPALRWAYASATAVLLPMVVFVVFRYQLDAGSCSVLLGVPLVATAVSSRQTNRGLRWTHGFLRLLGMAALVLLVVDTLPLVRIGLVLAVGLLGVDLADTLADRSFPGSAEAQTTA
jgi:uncharacterized protein